MYGCVKSGVPPGSLKHRGGLINSGVRSGLINSAVQGHGPGSQSDTLATPWTSALLKRNILRRELGFISSTALTINVILGSGVFITPASIFQQTRSFGLSLVLWLGGALIAYAASLCYLELAFVVKKSGGTFVFIKEAYSFTLTRPWMKTCGSLMGFLMVWGDTVICAGSAIPLLALGRYLCRPFFMECDVMPIYAVKMFSLSALMILTIVNVYSVRLSAALLTWLSFFKILVIAFVIILGTWKLSQQGSFPEDSQHPFEGSDTSPIHIALGLYGVTFAYDGWDAGIRVQEETKSIKTLKWMIYVSVPVVGVLYILTNICFFAVLSYDQISNTEAVGLLFGKAVLGEAGLIIFCLLSVVMIFGTANANLFADSRQFFVASREGLMPQFISGVHVSHHTPLMAILIKGFLTGVYVMIGSIDSLLNIFNAVGWFWYACAFFGLIIMRLTRPHAERPFEVLLLLPAVMTVVSILLVVLPLWQNPVPQLIGFAVVLTGVPVYAFFIMEKPCRLRPKVMDRLSTWMTSITSKLFNMELVGAFDPIAK